jgi:hypothetical protein
VRLGGEPRHCKVSGKDTDGDSCRIIDVFQPAGSIEAVYREAGSFEGGPPIHEALGIEGLARLFAAHGMKLIGPPLRWAE